MEQLLPVQYILHVIFNKHTLKLSYAYTSNMERIITNHNNRLLNPVKETTTRKKCNYRVPENCPLEGVCPQSDVIYQADVATRINKKNYYGSTVDFKLRWNNCKSSFNNTKGRHATELSAYIPKFRELIQHSPSNGQS